MDPVSTPPLVNIAKDVGVPIIPENMKSDFKNIVVHNGAESFSEFLDDNVKKIVSETL